MQIIILFFKYYHKISIKNYIINWFCPGERSKASLIVLSGNLKISRLKNAKINIKKGMLLLNTSIRTKEPFIGMLELCENAVINVEDTFSIYSGFHIILTQGATLNLGSGYINRGLKIRCINKISIGMDVAISENVTIWDTDAHYIVGKEDQMTQPIHIGNKVWIGNNVTILKGVTIGEGAIIAAGSVVNKSIPAGCLAAGVPAKVIRENVLWK